MPMGKLYIEIPIEYINILKKINFKYLIAVNDDKYPKNIKIVI